MFIMMYVQKLTNNSNDVCTLVYVSIDQQTYFCNTTPARWSSVVSPVSVWITCCLITRARIFMPCHLLFYFPNVIILEWISVRFSLHRLKIWLKKNCACKCIFNFFFKDRIPFILCRVNHIWSTVFDLTRNFMLKLSLMKISWTRLTHKQN